MKDNCAASTKHIPKHIRVCLLLSLTNRSMLLRNSLFKDLFKARQKTSVAFSHTQKQSAHFGVCQ